MNTKIWSGLTAIVVTTFLGAMDAITISSKAVASSLNDQEIENVNTFILKEQQISPIKTPTQVSKNGVKNYTGKASWYGPGFHGRRTASGQTFNQNDLTAAHRSLPFGTKVKVTNLRNGRSTVVRINDRGPFTGGRIIDLSAAAARAIGLYNSGVGSVRLEILGR